MTDNHDRSGTGEDKGTVYEALKESLILIVDDVPKNLQVMGNILSKEGYQIAFATNGKEAIPMIEDIFPDLILLDIMMPEMNGFEVCTTIKGSSKTKSIPIIFLTAKTETDDIVKGFRFGAVDYITKPFNSSELLARVRTHLELKRSKDIILQISEELIRKNMILEEMAISDSLTELYNHNYTITRLTEEIERSNRYSQDLSIIMFDIDHFKEINDMHGHQVGDEVLSRVSAILKSRLRRVDIVGRYGGEEFLVILTNTNLEQGITTAEKIRHDIEELTWSFEGLKTTISGGVCAHENGNDVELIKKADKLLYLAKENGRNRIES
ncbi:MAG: diguanylate cyclase [bacterium]|nr:diguanylate cyclase [bacterium]